MADNSVLTISIVTPDGMVYQNDQAHLVIVKTKTGELGIMRDHLPVIASLEVDEARVKYDNGKEDEIAVNGGFVEFSDNVLTIIADSAEKQGDIDVERAERARQRAQQKIQAAQSKHDNVAITRGQIALQRAVNRIHVARH
ncbi:F0F1 ATP synthase subunit epsilon [Nicoliella spurrieriana]|uniref:ATP synthase epsilon chain n=1 Tax=Nicoliella spurrieriana TaxID=2925830 RepID=A0A976X5A4_9LACO|nr:F0F1 ATP synthase subunit epsilon [Nicoliella spurrieriana]UQS86833.1 F0F1 ATP synthase subunit epsilon [Nicoliella spurrieriana]